MFSSRRVIAFLIGMICLSLNAQTSTGYNFLPASSIEVNSKSIKEKQLGRSKFWFGLKGAEADLVTTKKGYYPINVAKKYDYPYYIGLIAFDPDDRNAQTFACAPLKHTLEVGKKYQVRIQGFFPVFNSQIKYDLLDRFQSKNMQAVEADSIKWIQELRNILRVPMGFALSENMPKDVKSLSPETPVDFQIANDSFSFTFNFTAKEAANYLVIGNFLKDKEIPDIYKTNFPKYLLVHTVELKEETLDYIGNGGFEYAHGEPNGPGEWKYLQNWFSPNHNKEFHPFLPSPDYLSGDFNGNLVITGKGSARVGYSDLDSITLNENLSSQLMRRLEKGKNYYLEFDVCPFLGKDFKGSLEDLLEKYYTGTKLQFGFSKNRPHQSGIEPISVDQRLDYISNSPEPFNCGKQSMTFIANDHHNYITLGYLNPSSFIKNAEFGAVLDNLVMFEIPPEESPELAESMEINNPLDTEGVVEEEPIIFVSDDGMETDVTIKHETKVFQKKCLIKVFDHGAEDGDIISLMVNNQMVVEDLRIHQWPNYYKFEIDFNKGDNIIYPLAKNLGTIPPNTVFIAVDCPNEKSKEFRLYSIPGKSEALSVEY